MEQEKLRKVKTLGEAGEDVDDLSAWVTRNKKAEERAKAEARAKAAKVARQLEEQVQPPFSNGAKKGIKEGILQQRRVIHVKHGDGVG